ncbi:unnamed protein product [Didymodactylos carnosus]|uniref:Uncharacterized protein n=1 Tax=Didymodactylos carnosus TaxID=1234261 RepID=A0A814EN25_9BILA|nr:unnamed protein product [Didymodactylos carnosus]CAF0971539.1 unnamed protein product [Didymodactylos carnosus]CAF3691734.1 unnamed protein product [Didymodactylos carnosus]CAF3744550.1 unnamed protein product [Didymodactylos carnosus]
MTENAHTVENETIGSDKSRASTITSVDELVVSSEPDTRDVPCLTFRFWCIGLLFSIGIPFVNQFFFYRTHPLRMKSMLALLLSYPLGLLMARILPKKSISFGRGLTVSLNPGPFNIVEHMLIVSMTSTAIRQSYSIAILTVIKLFYKKSLNYGIAVLFTIIPQVLGYGIAGTIKCRARLHLTFCETSPLKEQHILALVP